MTSCDLCGREGNVFKVKIEGAISRVCDNCKKFGEVLYEENLLGKASPKEKFVDSREKMEVLIDDFHLILKKEREKKNLKQGEVADKINEKESVIQKVENGHMEPSSELVKKLEKFFSIVLVKEISGKLDKMEHIESKGMTLGDMIK